MSIFNVILKLLGWGKKNLGKWLPVIFAAEEQFRAGSGAEKFAMVWAVFEKEQQKLLLKLNNELKKKGLPIFEHNNDKLNLLADKGKKAVQEIVEYYNEAQALFPHSTP